MGIILIEESVIEEDRIFNISIENDAKDFKLEDGYYKLFFDHNMLYQKIEIIEKKSVEVDSSFIAFVPKDFIKVSQVIKKNLRFIVISSFHITFITCKHSQNIITMSFSDF